MASGTTEISDVIVPEIFNPYTQQITMEKSALVQSGVISVDPAINAMLAGGGLTFNVPSFRDLDNDEDNVSNDTGGPSTPNKIQTAQEIAVRLSRNQSWATADLVQDLAGADPAQAIANRVAAYWTRRLQTIFIATMQGIFADNDASPTGTDTHIQSDLSVDISGNTFTPGVTNFSAEATIDAFTTMGDASELLRGVMMHSIVYSRAQKNNLIDFIPDARGEVRIPTFLGRRVIVDDSLPNPAGVGAAQTDAGIYHTWLFGADSVRLGSGSAKVPTEIGRDAAANNGGGEEVLFTRRQYAMHPTGHAFIGNVSGAPGGPNNTATANNLAHAGSWSRVFSERKQIRIARLITRES